MAAEVLDFVEESEGLESELLAVESELEEAPSEEDEELSLFSRARLRVP